MPLCNKGFNQRSRLQRHKETAHPPNAPSAADLERAQRNYISEDEGRNNSDC